MRRRWITPLLLALLLSGCQATPQAIQEDGALRAMTEAEQQSAQAPRVSYAEVCAEDGRQIDVTLGEGQWQLLIKAQAQVPQVETVYAYTLSKAQPNREAALAVLFGADADSAREVDPGTAAVWEADLPGGIRKSLRFDVEGFIAIDYALDDGADQTGDWSAPVQKLQMDPDKAAAELNRIATALGVSGITIDGYSDNANRRGFYIYPNYTPFAVAPVSDRNSPLGQELAIFSPQRLTSLRWGDFMAIESAQPAEALLSLDEAIEIAGRHVGSALYPVAAAPFTQVSLRVRYQRDTQNDSWTARPVWYFCTDYTGMFIEASRAPGVADSYTSSFCVDAQTGVVDSRTTSVAD